MTAQAAVSVGESTKTGGTYPLFAMGATCWYFAARLSELGVTTPIGIANTAIGGQRIEEYMSNHTGGMHKCSQRSGEGSWQGADWDGRHFGDMMSPFLDMTVKGWTWYQVRDLSPVTSSITPIPPFSCPRWCSRQQPIKNAAAMPLRVHSSDRSHYCRFMTGHITVGSC